MRFYFTEKLSDKKFRTPEGFLLCKDCIIARTGFQMYTQEEMPYEPDGNGYINVERSPEEVFKPEAIASFAGKPFVIHHPSVDGEIVDVTPENWRDLACGTVLNPRRGSGIFNDVLMADILVTDQDAIELIMKNPYNELSCGYDADYEPLGPGKAKQVNIIGNHVARVESGRCGPKCRIYDSDKKLKEISMTTKTANKFGWLDGILNRATKARDASELASIKDEAIQMAEKEGGVSDGDHTHIHLHPHSSGDTEMSGSAAPNPMPKPAPTPAANPTQKTSMTDSDRITALEEGHKKIQDTLQSICKALGVGENGEMEDDGDNEFDYNQQAEEGEGENFGDEANLHRLEPHYGRRENAGIYEASDYHEGEFVENDVERPFDGTKPIKRGFGAEAPPGSSSAINLADKRNRVGARDSSKNLRAEWQRMIADAEVIIPGVRIPTADSSNGLNIFSTMNNFKRRVLLRVSQDLNQAVDLENITGGRSIKNMTADGISTVFRSLAAVYRDRNNTGVLHMNTVGNLPGARGPAHGIQSIQDFQKKINNMADSVWGTGGSTR